MGGYKSIFGHNTKALVLVVTGVTYLRCCRREYWGSPRCLVSWRDKPPWPPRCHWLSAQNTHTKKYCLWAITQKYFIFSGLKHTGKFFSESHLQTNFNNIRIFMFCCLESRGQSESSNWSQGSILKRSMSIREFIKN